jgi:hypothetical protein
LVPIGPVVSEKKLEIWQVYRRRTPNDGNSSHGPLVQVNLKGKHHYKDSSQEHLNIPPGVSWFRVAHFFCYVCIYFNVIFLLTIYSLLI